METKFKNITIGFCLLILFSCKPKEIDSKQIVIRESIAYEIGSEKPFTGIAISKYDNGETEFVKPYINGELSGTVRRFNDKGILSDETNYKDGLRHGFDRSYLDNGLLWTEFYFNNGVKEGEYIMNDVNGGKFIEGTYKNGKRDGEEKYYNEYGLVYEIANYKNDVRDGFTKRYFLNGELEKESLYENGKFIYVKWYDEKGKFLGMRYSDGTEIISE